MLQLDDFLSELIPLVELCHVDNRVSFIHVYVCVLAILPVLWEMIDQAFVCLYLQPANLNLGGGVGGSGMGVGPHMGGPMGPADMNTPQKDLKYQIGMGNMMVSVVVF